MKICVLGNKLLAKDFKNLNFSVIDVPFSDFKIEHVINYDIIINTYDYICEDDGTVNMTSMVKCNIDIPLLLSGYCRQRRRRYVHMSTSKLYKNLGQSCDEKHPVVADDDYLSSKLLGEHCCDKDNLIIRTQNLFNDVATDENALFRAITTNTPTKNTESYTWSVDCIRGIVSLLKNKRHGIYNISSEGSSSQSAICKILDLENKVSIRAEKNESYVRLDIDHLMSQFIPAGTTGNIKKCFDDLKVKLES